jgi:hypothetical protein
MTGRLGRVHRGDSFGSVKPISSYAARAVMVLMAVSLIVASCGSSQVESDSELPKATDLLPVTTRQRVATTTTFAGPVDVSTTVAPLTSSTLVIPAPKDGNVGQNDTDSASPTTTPPTTTSPPRIPEPDAETFEPATPQGGFVTFEPDA